MALRRFRILKTGRPRYSWLKPFFWGVSVFVLLLLVLVILFQGYRITWFGFEPKLIQILSFIGGLGTLIEIGLIQFRSDSGMTKGRRWFYFVIGGLILLTLVLRQFILPLIVVYQVVAVGGRISRTRFFSAILGDLRQRSFRLLVLTFTILIALGTIFLTMPLATTDGHGASLINALFTATSATCVTGLIVKDTPTYFSRFGQLVILTLIQLGALGIMSFYAVLAVVLGRRFGLGERRAVAELIEEAKNRDIIQAVRYILLFTLIAEGMGAVVLFLRWLFDFNSPWQTVYYAVFHSVSAFCNAGFSLFSDSFVRYQSDLIFNLIIIGLIVFGGLGFTVVHELISRRVLRQPLKTTVHLLSTHTRLVLTTSGVLIVLGTLFFFFLEFDNVLSSLPMGTKLLASLFQSVTARTAGFNTVALDSLRPAIIFIWGILMFIGASPGGTGGGIKTTTFTVLLLTLRARLKGEEEVSFGKRFIPKDVIYRAVAVAGGGVMAVTLIFIILLITQKMPFTSLLFETFSAFGTVGLSTGITKDLTNSGKLALIVLMFIGRLGPVTLALALGRKEKIRKVVYPQARVIVG